MGGGLCMPGSPRPNVRHPFSQNIVAPVHCSRGSCEEVVVFYASLALNAYSTGKGVRIWVMSYFSTK